MDSRSAHQMGLRQLTQALALLPVAEDGGSIQDQSFPSNVPAFELGPPHADAHSLDDQAALQLRDRPDDDHDRPAQGTTRVDLLAEADELDVETDQFVQHLEEVFR